LASSSSTNPFHAKYTVLKSQLLTNEYEHWAASFPSGNNHGPGHINRVLDKLNELLGADALDADIIAPYELFLCMMAILYHDVGILRARQGHPDWSAAFLDRDENAYVINPQDKPIIRAAVVSHSSSKDINDECSAFSQIEQIGSHDVRPRVVAALVRLADELDEDYRRAPPQAAEKIGLPPDSEFFWMFCQRVLGVRPERQKLEIAINVRFEKSDVARIVFLGGSQRSFISAFAEKLAKINHERKTVAAFLPPMLRYHRLVVSVKPLPDSPQWQSPRDIIFNDSTTATDFIRAIPELSVRPFKDLLRSTLERLNAGDLEGAERALRTLEQILPDLQVEERLRTLWLMAVAHSLRAKRSQDPSDRSLTLDGGVAHLKAWYHLGRSSAWAELGTTAATEVYQIANDEELNFLYTQRKERIEEFLRNDGTLDDVLLLKHVHHGGGGGCLPAGVPIETPAGPISIDDVREGMIILSIDLQQPPAKIATKVVRVHRLQEDLCIRLNRNLTFTASQPLYCGNGSWVLAGKLVPGSRLEEADGQPYLVSEIERIEGVCNVYTLTTDHPSHNFIVSNLVCKNKEMK